MVRNGSNYRCCFSLVHGVGKSSTVGLDISFAVNERAVDACSNFVFAILDKTAAISVLPRPPIMPLGVRVALHWLGTKTPP
eukprot:scaffold290381_cov22-Tisochrysis_lutea.AAC.1